MDLHEQRMQCLKMAFDLGGKPEAVLSAAQQLLEFVSGPTPMVASAVTADETLNDARVSTETVPDPIAACGTALVMQEGGELADAVATAEPPSAAASQAEKAEDTPLAADSPPDVSEQPAGTDPVEETTTQTATGEEVAEASDSADAAENAEPEAVVSEASTESSTDLDPASVTATLEDGGEPTTAIN